MLTHIGQQFKGEVAYVNFERQPEMPGCFVSNDPKVTVALLEARLAQAVRPAKTLLFLDEIQAAPEVLPKLRWFYEELPELAVAAAGSLLDFTLAQPSFSVPVGRITYGHLEPMTFIEFLLACGEDRLAEVIETSTPADGVPDVLHTRLMQLVRTYTLVGGMPAAVNTWVQTRSLAAVNELHRDLIQTMRDDFAKYADVAKTRVNTLRVSKVFSALPRLVGRKFVPAQVDRDEKSFTLKEAFALLALARVVTPVRRTAANGVPLGAEVDERHQKVCMLDVGLYCTMTGVDAVAATAAAEIALINEGQLAEQLVGQELRACRPFNQEPGLFTWSRDAKNSNAEVDYVIQTAGHIVPVEVKAGATGRLRSLHMMVREKNLGVAVRVNSQPMLASDVETALPTGPKHEFKLLSIPFYMTSELPRLLAPLF